MKLKTKHVDSFVRLCQAQGLKPESIRNYLICLHTIEKYLESPMEGATREGMVGLVSRIRGNGLADATKSNILMVLKKYMKFLNGGEYPESIRWLRNRGEYRRVEPLLTIREIWEIMDVCRDLRERCLISLMYESGARIGELLGMRKSDIEFDGWGCYINFRAEKSTDIHRRLRILRRGRVFPLGSAGMLRRMCSKSDNGGLLFGYDYCQVRGVFKRLRYRSHLGKHFHPHLLRKTRATMLAKHLPERLLMKFFGWRKPETASHYVMLSCRDLEEALRGCN